jgi:lipid-binding SYLF domain-containing protein
MTRFCTFVGAGVLVLSLATAPVRAGKHELATVTSAGAVVETFATLPAKHIPPLLMHDAKGIAILPRVVKTGLLFDRRFGHGVLLVRQPDGGWSHPIYITLEGRGVGLEAGIEATDLVLVFRTEAAMDRILKGKGKLTLGSDVTIAAGPIGAEVEATRRAEIFSYAHSRGLFAGLALEGDRVEVDPGANKEMYHVREGHPSEVLAIHGGPEIAEVVRLKEHLTRMSGAPVVVPVKESEHKHH